MRGRVSTRKLHRRAFTLLELLLTLSLLVMISALTWPMMSRAFDGQRLRTAADQVRTQMGIARAEAITSGTVYAMQFQLATGQYVIQPWDAELASAAMQPPGTTFGPATDPNQPLISSTARVINGQLPEGIVFFSGGEMMNGTSPAGGFGMTAPAVPGQAATVMQSPQALLFYPDGTSTSGQVWLVNTRERYVPIELRGLTGIAKVGEIVGAEALAR